MVNIYESVIKKLDAQEAVIKGLAETALYLRTAREDTILEVPQNLTAAFDPYKTTDKIIDKAVFSDGMQDDAITQLELVARLIQKAELAMEIVELQSVLAARALKPSTLEDIQNNFHTDNQEVTVIRYQYRRACNNYIHNPNRLFDLEEGNAKAQETDVRKRQYQVDMGIKDPALLNLSEAELLSKLGTTRLSYALLSITENNIHLESAESRVNEAFLLLKGADEGILPHASKIYINHMVLERLDQAGLVLADCEERTRSTRKFLGKVYDMMGQSDSLNFTADRYAPAPLNIINKIAP